MKTIIKSFILLMLFSSFGYSAEGYYALSKSTTTGKATMYLAGDINVALSSATISTPVVTLDGTGIYVIDGADISTVTPLGFFGNFIGDLTGNADTATSVPISGVDLSTVTTALMGYASLANANTFASSQTINEALLLTGLATFDITGLTTNSRALSIDNGSVGGYMYSIYADGEINGNHQFVLRNSTGAVGGGSIYEAITLEGAGDPLVRFNTEGAVTPNWVVGMDNSSNIFGIQAGAGLDGSADFVILTDGKVGINDTTPTYMLDVNGTGRYTGAVTMDSTLGVTGQITSDVTATNIAFISPYGRTVLGYDRGAHFNIRGNEPAQEILNIEASSGQTERIVKVSSYGVTSGNYFVIDKDGQVGINDTTPTYMLDVNGTGRFTGAVTMESTLNVATSIGISSATPTHTLSVGGDINISGGFYANGVAVSGLGDAVLAADNDFSGENTFSDTASTQTFSGFIDIGISSATATASQTADAVCPTGTFIISGGGQSNAACGQYSSYQLNSTTWRTQCGSAVSMTSHAICGRVKW